MTGRTGKPLPGCPARHGTGPFAVTGADFVFEVRDTPDGGGGGTVTEIIGYFRPPACAESGPGPAGTDPGAEPDLVAVAALEVPAGSPVSRLAWQAFRSQAGPNLLGQLLRAAVLACPCTFPAAACAALDDATLLGAIEQAARPLPPPCGLTPPGHAGHLPRRLVHHPAQHVGEPPSRPGHTTSAAPAPPAPSRRAAAAPDTEEIPAMPLSAKDIHPHVSTAGCRRPVLRGIVWRPTWPRSATSSEIPPARTAHSRNGVSKATIETSASREPPRSAGHLKDAGIIPVPGELKAAADMAAAKDEQEVAWLT
jgi:hypothetical protein